VDVARVGADGGELFEAVASRLPHAAARLASMGAQVATARAVYRHAAAMCDAGLPFRRSAAVAKLLATDGAVGVAHDAVELCGAAASADDHPAAVRLRDAKACQIYEGTNQVQRVVIARDLLRP
jgi:alkylation response protein AidB-like acyl-CoA dehydrogenase